MSKKSLILSVINVAGKFCGQCCGSETLSCFAHTRLCSMRGYMQSLYFMGKGDLSFTQTKYVGGKNLKVCTYSYCGKDRENSGGGKKVETFNLRCWD